MKTVHGTLTFPSMEFRKQHLLINNKRLINISCTPLIFLNEQSSLSQTPSNYFFSSSFSLQKPMIALFNSNSHHDYYSLHLLNSIFISVNGHPLFYQTNFGLFFNQNRFFLKLKKKLPIFFTRHRREEKRSFSYFKFLHEHTETY